MQSVDEKLENLLHRVRILEKVYNDGEDIIKLLEGTLQEEHLRQDQIETVVQEEAEKRRKLEESLKKEVAQREALEKWLARKFSSYFFI